MLVVGKAKALEDRRGPRPGRPSVDIGKAGLDVCDAMRVGGVFGFGYERRPLHIGRQNRVDERDLVAGNLLAHAADLPAERQLDRAGVERQLAPDDAKERGLAGAVAPDKTDLVACRDYRRGVLEQRTALDRIGDVVDA
jgi:hypothetical protein